MVVRLKDCSVAKTIHETIRFRLATRSSNERTRYLEFEGTWEWNYLRVALAFEEGLF